MVLHNLLQATTLLLMCLVYIVDFVESEYSRLFIAWDSVYWKLFQVNDQNCSSDICRFTGFLPSSVEIDICFFVCKLPFTGNNVLTNLYFMFGQVRS